MRDLPRGSIDADKSHFVGAVRIVVRETKAASEGNVAGILDGVAGIKAPPLEIKVTAPFVAGGTVAVSVDGRLGNIVAANIGDFQKDTSAGVVARPCGN